MADPDPTRPLARWEKSLERGKELSGPAWMKAFADTEPAWMRFAGQTEAALAEVVPASERDLAEILGIKEPRWLRAIYGRPEETSSELQRTLGRTEPAWMRALHATDDPWVDRIKNTEPAWLREFSGLGPTGLQAILARLEAQQGALTEMLRETPALEALAAEPDASQAAEEQVAAVRSELPAAEEVERKNGPVIDDAVSTIADERDAILTMLRRFAMIAGGASTAGVNVPAWIVVMLIAFVLLGEVADEMLTKRERADGG